MFNFVWMENSETLRQYYEMTCRKIPAELERTEGVFKHFNVLVRNNCFLTMPFRRRDYYKICLCRGEAVLSTEKGDAEICRPAIFFSNPVTKFGWRNISKDQQGYICIFNELYINAELKRELKLLQRLFEDDLYPFCPLSDEQYDLLQSYFKMMSDEYQGSFKYKENIVQHLLKLIIYTVMKIRLSGNDIKDGGNQDLLVTRFLDLLDAQFPVDSPQNPIDVKTPRDFAERLNVHVNHLNFIIKHHTGKTTSQLIQEKKISEALDLLKHTDWTVAEIASSLGFEYPQYFNVFFKKQIGKSPGMYREV